jgi:Domain of unknown function (DUF927)
VIAAMEKAVVPLAASDPADAVLMPIKGSSFEPAFVSPVPASAESVTSAATRLVGKAPQAIWNYTDGLGALSFAVARWDNEDGTKKILPLSWLRNGDGSEGWALKNHPAPRPLYNLGLLNASPTASVVIEGWARWLRWRDEDGRVHTQPISDADLHGDPRALCAMLAGLGLKVATGPNRGKLLRYLNEASVQSRVTIVPRTGWHEVGDKKVFALPNETFGSARGETVIVQGATTAPFEKSGSLADWQSGVGSLVTGHARGVFAVSVALAGPLLGLLGLEGGGFHFCGQSSRGKSTLVEAAASVWGKGAIPGFVRPWRTTANALEGAAAIHSDTLLVLDELGMIDPREAAAAAYQLAAGSGKGRSARDGSLRTSLTWRTMVISTGEVRLSDKLVEGKQRARAGQQVRLVDIPADAGAGFGGVQPCRCRW